MKRINKMIRNTIIEIVVVIAIVFLTIPIWQSFDLSAYETIAANYNYKLNTELEISDLSDYVLYQVSDELAITNIKPINIKLTNNTSISENYSLCLMVSKESTLDYRVIKVKYLNDIKNLSDYQMIEDEEYYYFSLSDGQIGSNVIENELLLWIDSSKDADIDNKSFNFNIINNSGQML